MSVKHQNHDLETGILKISMWECLDASTFQAFISSMYITIESLHNEILPNDDEFPAWFGAAYQGDGRYIQRLSNVTYSLPDPPLRFRFPPLELSGVPEREREKHIQFLYTQAIEFPKIFAHHFEAVQSSLTKIVFICSHLPSLGKRNSMNEIHIKIVNS